MSAESLVIEYDFCATPFGDCLFARTPRGLCRIEFTDDRPGAALDRLQAAHPGAELLRCDLVSLSRQIFSASGVVPLAVDAAGTDFQQRVWAALRRIPPGATCSYGELAAAIGRPGAARAVGRAVGSNPVAVVVPCHRVLPSGGGPGGYRWGPQRKLDLLEWESRAA